MRLPLHDENTSRFGYTVLEVVVAISIFGCVAASALNLIARTERIRGRAIFVESASRLAAGESERLRSIAACGTELADSSYTEDISGRLFKVERKLIESKDVPSFQLKAREPYQIEIVVSDNNSETITPLRFKLLIGQDNP